MTVKIKNVKLRIKLVTTSHGIDARIPNHHVLKITLKNDEVFALDMTGPQFGWRECIMDWDKFSESRVQSVKEVRAFGTSAKSNLSQTYQVYEVMTKGLYRFLSEWQQSNTTQVAMMKLPEETYRQKRDLLFGFMDEAMSGLNASAQENGDFDVREDDNPTLSRVPTDALGSVLCL